MRWSSDERLGDVDLHVVDVLPVPDRLEQAVGEAEGQDVLRRLLAQEVVDAEDLLARRTSRGARALSSRALRRSVPNGFSMMIRERSTRSASASICTTGQRRAGRHAEVVQSPRVVAELVLGLLRRRRAAPTARRPWARTAGVDPKAAHSAGVTVAAGELAAGPLGEGAEPVVVEVVQRRADDPARRHSPARWRCSRPGSSLRLARSPVAPNSTMTCGLSGAMRLDVTSLGSLTGATLGPVGAPCRGTRRQATGSATATTWSATRSARTVHS